MEISLMALILMGVWLAGLNRYMIFLDEVLVNVV